MAEVQEFERHRRFRKYLAKEDARARNAPRPEALIPSWDALPISSQCASPDCAEPDDEVGPREPAVIAVTADFEDAIQTHNEIVASKLLSLPPRRPPKVDEPEESSSQTNSMASRSNVPDPEAIQEAPAAAYMGMLPPPFSLGTRVVSDEHSLPSHPSNPRSPVGRDERGQTPPMTPPRGSSLGEAVSAAHASPSPISARTRLLRSAARFVEAYVRSPSRASPPPRTAGSASATTAQEEASERLLATPSGTDPRLRIYTDRLPASSQPQTPQNLPEARHQSRFQGSYTAPVRRARAVEQPSYHLDAVRERHSRAHSPSGMDTPGFRGLYGGIENSDDTTLFLEASRLHESHSIDEDGN
ncbi:hypothetical protein BJ170DRAFT_590364 [Xylariales sp. AK1849]|nr:hypothetical protein BJ170DRAFT_590364 [Xylariales sp. AK1849]